jgi:hypothetical protein
MDMMNLLIFPGVEPQYRFKKQDKIVKALFRMDGPDTVDFSPVPFLDIPLAAGGKKLFSW